MPPSTSMHLWTRCRILLWTTYILKPFWHSFSH